MKALTLESVISAMNSFPYVEDAGDYKDIAASLYYHLLENLEDDVDISNMPLGFCNPREFLIWYYTLIGVSTTCIARL